MTAPQPYRVILAGNVAAQRARLGLHQKSLAERMRALGFKTWSTQAVSETEAGRRAIQAHELLGLALALQTTVLTLMVLPLDMESAALPSGEVIGAQRVTRNDGSATWEGNQLKVSPY